ncbi:MAG: ATP-binding protein [Oscillospiraceae bacterium]|nr:ATP-binding protein [Oscillospiraceae bacterium]
MENKTIKTKNKLAAHFRNINIFFIIIILIAVSAVCVALIDDLTDRASRDYVRFHTTEAVGALGMLLNHEINLVSHSATADEITAWFADEDDIEKRQSAYLRMMHFAQMFQIGGVYFVIDTSLNEFSIDYSTPFDEFLPMNVLDPDRLYDQWYFDSLNSEFDFTLNLDVDKVTNTARMWINYKVVRNGVPVGITCSALQFDDVFDEMFGIYDEGSIRGIIVDHSGFVQIDSDVPDPTLLTNEMDEFEDTVKPHIFDVVELDDDTFRRAVNRHLEQFVPHQGSRIEPDVIVLSSGVYMSIVPIQNTNWLKITFYDSGNLLGRVSVLPPIIAVISAFLIYLFASSILINRLVFKPLNKLTYSMSAAGQDSDGIFGLQRDDEIGELARETKISWDRLGEQTKELRDTAAQLEIAITEANSANAAKSAFLANMSHEIRTPMNALLGLTEILIQHDELPAEIEEGLEKMYSSCDLLLGIINDILDFSKIEAGKLDIVPAQYNVASMINDSAQLNLMRINGKPIDFDLQIDESIPAQLIGDELRLKQILNNLLSNAFKYTEEGNVTLSITSEVIRGKQGIILTMSVRDTGHGMTREQLAKMFDEYSRFEEGKKHATEGTGLGLAITQSLIHLMNGEIHVESKPGFGSLFVVRIPQKTVNTDVLGKDVTENLLRFRESLMTSRRRSQIQRDPMPYGSVLIVDDVETNLYVAAGLMKLYRLQIETVMSGFEAIDLIKSGRTYDIIFMDHMMPEMDGIETTKRLRELGYNSPVIALTANAVAGQADMFLQNGFDEFISKPIDIRQLDTVLNTLIRDKQTPETLSQARALLGTPINGSDEEKQTEGKQKQMLMESFARDARRAIPIVQAMLQNKDNANEDELKSFTTAVHGMKSSLANIEQPGLSEIAYTLEQAGRSFNLGIIDKIIPKFLTDLATLLDKIDAAQSKTADEMQTPPSDEKELREKFSAISEMCSMYNRKGALDILSEIKHTDEEMKKALEAIEEFIYNGDFEAAGTVASSFTAKGN